MSEIAARVGQGLQGKWQIPLLPLSRTKDPRQPRRCAKVSEQRKSEEEVGALYL